MRVMPELPFTAEQFFAVFTAYNRSVWPAQIVLSALLLPPPLAPLGP